MNLETKKNYKLFGFTLIEISIVSVIVILITSVSLANYKAGERGRRVAIGADGISTALNLGVSYALTGKETNNVQANCRTPQYYYLVFGYTNSYTLNAVNNCGGIDRIQTFYLPDRTRIGGMSIEDVSAASGMSILFSIPFGRTQAFKDAEVNYNSYIVSTINVVSTEDAGVSRTVRIDGISGSISQY